MPVHPEIKKILDFIPQSDTKQKIIPEEHRKMFNAPVLPVEKRVQVYSVEERTIPNTGERDLETFANRAGNSLSFAAAIGICP